MRRRWRGRWCCLRCWHGLLLLLRLRWGLRLRCSGLIPHMHGVGPECVTTSWPKWHMRVHGCTCLRAKWRWQQMGRDKARLLPPCRAAYVSTCQWVARREP